MTLLERARQTWPGLSQADLKIALWSLTTYPAGRDEDVLEDLRSAWLKSGGDLLQALQQADQQLTKHQTGQ